MKIIFRILLLIIFFINILYADNYYDELIKAVSNDDEETINNIIETNPNSTDKNGNTILMLAIANNKNDLAKKLILNGANVNLQNNNQQTPLMIAVIKNNPQIVEFLINNKAKVDIIDIYNNTALLYAIKYTNNEIIDKLYNRTEAQQLDNFELLLLAIKNNNLSAVKYFLNKTNDIKNNPEKIDQISNLALISDNYSISKAIYLELNIQNKDFLKNLLVNSVINFDEDPDFFYKLYESYNKDLLNYNFALKEETDYLGVFQQSKTEYHSKSLMTYQGSLLQIAIIYNKNPKLITYLLNNNKTLDEINPYLSMTPLALSIYFENLVAYDLLKKNGAKNIQFGYLPKINNQSLIDEQAFFYSCLLKKPEMLIFLLQNNININLKDSQGRNGLIYVCLGSDLLYENTTKVFAILFENKINLNEKDLEGRNALHYAFMTGDKISIETLLAKDPDLQNIKDSSGLTPNKYLINSKNQLVLTRVYLKDFLKFNFTNLSNIEEFSKIPLLMIYKGGYQNYKLNDKTLNPFLKGLIDNKINEYNNLLKKYI